MDDYYEVTHMSSVHARFGEIIEAGGRRKDQEFGDHILSFDFNTDNEASR